MFNYSLCQYLTLFDLISENHFLAEGKDRFLKKSFNKTVHLSTQMLLLDRRS